MGENGKKILLIVIIIAALAAIGMMVMSQKRQADFANSQLPNKAPEGFGTGPVIPLGGGGAASQPPPITTPGTATR